jgi:hypothetical protein
VKAGASYPTALMAEVREMHAGGWRVPEIHQRLAQRGERPLPTRTTLYSWVNEAFAERQRAKSRAYSATMTAQAATFRLNGGRVTSTYQAAFIRALRAEGVGWPSIAKVCGLVFGGQWSRERAQRLATEETIG